MSIPTPPSESSPKPMTPERIAEIRALCERAREIGGRNTSYGRMSLIGDELCDEIERLRAWLDSIDALSHYEPDWRAQPTLEDIHLSVQDALNGEAAPE